MKLPRKRQCAIKNIPPQLDEQLGKRMKKWGKGLTVHHDLDPLIGIWKEDPEFDEILRLQDRIDLRY